MCTKKQKKSSLVIGLIAGAVADSVLRIVNGDDGNLLVHTVVFLGTALIVAGTACGLFSICNNVVSRKK